MDYFPNQPDSLEAIHHLAKPRPIYHIVIKCFIRNATKSMSNTSLYLSRMTCPIRYKKVLFSLPQFVKNSHLMPTGRKVSNHVIEIYRWINSTEILWCSDEMQGMFKCCSKWRIPLVALNPQCVQYAAFLLKRQRTTVPKCNYSSLTPGSINGFLFSHWTVIFHFHTEVKWQHLYVQKHAGF